MKLFSKIKDNPLLSFLIGLLILTFGAFVGVLFCECIETYISNLLGLSNKNETLKFLGIGMGGVLIALQALMSYKRAKAMEETAQAQADAANAQVRATEEQAKANQHTEEGQRQERLRNAIEHLGHEKDSVRLGGAYELFHLAQDTEELRQTVLDILCAHIRWTTGESKYRETHKSKPSEEVQSLLTLMFVQEHEVFKDCHINLQGSWLNGADLKGARLTKARLTRAHLQEADLYVTKLQEAGLREAHLQNAILFWAHLQGATLDMAHLQGADLRKALLQETSLREAHLQGVDLCEAHLQEARLDMAQLQGACLRETQLQGATLLKTDLRGTKSQIWPSSTFSQRMRESIDQEGDLFGATFEGGLSQGDQNFLVRGLPDEIGGALREKLEFHIGKPPSSQLPKDCGAITGAYTEEDAEKWIAEYNEAMSSVPKEDAN